MQHVDLVKNEWLAGFQVVVARASAEGDTLHVDSSEPERWRPVILRPFTDRGTGDQLGPERPTEFLGALHEHIRGDYLFATVPHEESECPFADGRLVVPLQPVRIEHEFQALRA